jgi:hypothetical protein
MTSYLVLKKKFRRGDTPHFALPLFIFYPILMYFLGQNYHLNGLLMSLKKDVDSRVFTRMLCGNFFDPVTLTFDLENQ